MTITSRRKRVFGTFDAYSRVFLRYGHKGTPFDGPAFTSVHTASIPAHVQNPDVVECYREEFARAREFLSFGNWSTFTQSCCCMSRSNVTDPTALDEHITELWSCSNKLAATERERTQRPIIYKERQRRDMLPGTTVSPVRGFCETVFRDQHGEPMDVEPSFDEEVGKLGIYWRNDDGSAFVFHDVVPTLALTNLSFHSAILASCSLTQNSSFGPPQTDWLVTAG